MQFYFSVKLKNENRSKYMPCDKTEYGYKHLPFEKNDKGMIKDKGLNLIFALNLFR